MLGHALKHALAGAWRATASLGGHVVTNAAADRDLAELRRGLAAADHVAETLLERGGPLTGEPPPTLDVHSLLLKMEPSLRLAVGPAVRLTLGDAGHGGLVAADLSTLETIVRRLVDGAARSMPHGGDLVLSAGWLDCLSGTWPAGPRAPHRSVRITLAGNGRESERRAWWRILEPSTSASGRATESIAGMVDRLDGCILIEGAAGEGHRLHLCLPAAFQYVGRDFSPGAVTRN